MEAAIPRSRLSIEMSTLTVKSLEYWSQLRGVPQDSNWVRVPVENTPVSLGSRTDALGTVASAKNPGGNGFGENPIPHLQSEAGNGIAGAARLVIDFCDC